MLWIGSLIAVLLSVGPDLPRAGGAGALALMTGGAALLALPLPPLGALARIAPARGAFDRASPYALAALVAAPPAALAALRLGPAWPSPARWVLPALLGLAAALFAATLLLARRMAGPAAPRLRASACIAALALAALFLSMHLPEGTLAAVRPGTGALHAALFGGTWLASAALAAPWAAALAGGAASLGRRARIAHAAAALAIGAALLVADRRALVDLYPGVHRWLGWTGLASVAAGASIAMGARAGAPWRAATRAAAALLVAAAALFAARAPSLTPGHRGALARSATGKTLLAMIGAGRRTGGPLPEHPLLRVDQRLDAPGPPGDLNILLVTVDALRADRVHGRGCGSPPAPCAPTLVDAPARLGAFARESTRFHRAYTQGTRTALAMSALMLGRYSANVDYRLMVYRRGALLDPRTLTEEQLRSFKGNFVFSTVPQNPSRGMLAERLQRAGLSTSAAAYAGRNEFFQRGGEFDAGFDRFADLTSMQWAKPTSGEVLRVALGQVEDDSRKERFFQWIHFYDPHEAGGDAARYDHYMQALDASFGALLDALAARGLLDRTVVVLTADHGEALGEHGHRGHATSLYDEQARIPLLVRVPGSPGRDVAEPVALVDVTATLAVLAGAETRDLDGVSLWPTILRGEAPPRRPVFIELHRYYSNQGVCTADLKGVVLGDWKLIQDRMRGTEELFHLGEDPAELDDRSVRDEARAEELRAVLDSFVSRAEAAHPLP
ncbi:MAG: sulfatase [Polyangiaceae bacterium]|nr:sulfatase [Polyangiaceae bacterium]